MIIGIGIDIIETLRIQKMIDEYGDVVLTKFFTDVEIDYCNSFGKRKYEHFAARFAIKEAFSKATGNGLTNSFVFRDVGIINQKSGKPQLVLEGKMKEQWSNSLIHISIAHTKENAIGYVIIESND